MAVAFFIAVRVFVGFPNDNGHRVLPHMKRNAQRPIPLSVQGVGTAASFRSSPPLARLLYSMDVLSHVKAFSMGFASAPCAWPSCSASSWLSKAAQLTDPEKADAYLFHLRRAAILEGKRQHAMRN